MYKKIWRGCLLTCLLAGSGSYATLLAQNEQTTDIAIPTKIIDCFRAGNSRMLSRWLSKRTLINLKGVATFCNPTVARRLLINFFKENPPIDLEFLHQGISQPGKKDKIVLLYYIATYHSHTNYNMYILVKRSPKGHRIQRISFEEK